MTSSFLHQPDTSDAHEAEVLGEAALGPERIAPVRLLERGTAFERQLLGAQPPGMPPGSRERLARALQLPDIVAESVTRDGGASGTNIASSDSAEAAGRVARWSKLATVAVLGGVVLGVPPLVTRWSGNGAEHVAPVPQPAAAVVTRLAPEHDGPQRAAEPERRAAEPEPAALVAAPREPVRVMTRRAAPPAAGRSPKLAQDRSLGAELRALERSQRALAQGSSSEAQQALDDYTARFPQGELAMEAELLQIDVLVARGERQRARELARELALRPQAARYRERLQMLLRRAPGAAGGRQ